jgi:SAM-dependent methyltransferase/glycosyltransferase involved in cell wall biosynthesis
MTVRAENIDLMVYTPSNEASIAHDFGRPEYSYYFVMQRFLPLLEPFGRLTPITSLDRLCGACRRSRESGRIPILMCFAPPHLLPIDPPCAVVPVFAWEFDRLPDETWTGDPRQNWVETLRHTPAAVTHSEHTRRLVTEALGASYPIASIPAPVWDAFYTLESWDGSARTLSFAGAMIDTSRGDVKNDALDLRLQLGQSQIVLSGPVFASVLSPTDGRKNWGDLVTGFVLALKDAPDATLVLKLVHFDAEAALEPLISLLEKLWPYRCRVIAICAFLDDEAYRDLVRATAFAVNASLGEGQCLPLMEFLSAGRPAVAPSHSAMADYIDNENAMIVRSSLEWTSWPADPRASLRCMRRRPDWESLRDAYREAYAVATRDAERYRRMSRHARERLKGHNSIAVVGARLAVLMDDVIAQAVELEKSRGGRSSLMERLLCVEDLGQPSKGVGRADKQGRTDVWRVGIVDAQMSGWFCGETGELYRGFPVAAQDIVVDVGCGEGNHLSFCAKFNPRIIGIDVDGQALAVARSTLASSAARGVELHEATAEALPLADAFATRIICSEVLEHVDDPRQALAELHRIGAPGALYLLTVPDKLSEELQGRVAPEQYFRKPNHVRVFERDALPRLAREAGLDVLSHSAYGFFWSVWWGLFWGCNVDLRAPDHPALLNWTEAWAAFVKSPEGARIKTGLDAFLPKSRVVLARKPG